MLRPEEAWNATVIRWSLSLSSHNRKECMSNRSKAQILVVDDDPNVRESLGMLLMSAGYDVATADNGVSAVSHLSKAIPDLIVTDLDMPHMSGVELISHVRNSHPSISIVAMSGDYRWRRGACQHHRRQVLPQRTASPPSVNHHRELDRDQSGASKCARRSRPPGLGFLEKGEKYAWNRLNCSAGFVSGGCSPNLESQPFLGLLPERRVGFAPRHRSYFVVAWQDLVAGCSNI